MYRLCRPILVSILALIPAMVTAQFDTEHPGYFPVEDLGILPEESINLEINLTGAMMKFIALATDEDEPELSKLVEGLESIRVRGADLESFDTEQVRSGIRNASERLAKHGWISMVRIRDDHEEVHLYFKDQDGEMVGLTVLSLEDDEAMLINLVGKIDPSALASLGDSLDLPQLEKAAQDAGDSE